MSIQADNILRTDSYVFLSLFTLLDGGAVQGSTTKKMAPFISPLSYCWFMIVMFMVLISIQISNF